MRNHNCIWCNEPLNGYLTDQHEDQTVISEIERVESWRALSWCNHCNIVHERTIEETITYDDDGCEYATQEIVFISSWTTSMQANITRYRETKGDYNE